ncbi:hypothetical protein CPB83DRAFT_871812 [Crepidotus variabilis]|uniref:Uncharacterized protein n=1 Tax=Crepidotus variabilis TaxID=179855 RepID=A0A9P6JJP9_9AGAR|nr:hypothetical protein CPB83DRAFT_871812 [Crepidotus variabilis]
MADPFRNQHWCFTPCASFIVDTPESALIASTLRKISTQAFEKETFKHRLNGVLLPFWRDWLLSDPSTFLTPEPLHHWHKQFWDHDTKWCIHAVGSHEINFRFSILQPCTGFQHFKEGISSLKQVTGRDHRDMQHAVSPGFLIAIRALLDFRYLAQSTIIDDNIGKKGLILNWQIPKLEFLQSVVPNLRLNGVPIQWTADVTEHTHISVVKEPADSGNNQ